MSIEAGIRTPDVYTDVNLNTQRGGLVVNTQRVLFVTADTPVAPLDAQINIYDKRSADVAFGADSVAGRMITAAIKTNRVVSVQAVSSGSIAPPNPEV